MFSQFFSQSAHGAARTGERRKKISFVFGKESMKHPNKVYLSLSGQILIHSLPNVFWTHLFRLISLQGHSAPAIPKDKSLGYLADRDMLN